MKVRKYSGQRNVIVDRNMYTANEISKLFMDDCCDSFDNGETFRIFLNYVDRLEVKCFDGYYYTVAVMKQECIERGLNKEYFISL